MEKLRSTLVIFLVLLISTAALLGIAVLFNFIDMHAFSQNFIRIVATFALLSVAGLLIAILTDTAKPVAKK